jgi:hypothetical protein
MPKRKTPFQTAVGKIIVEMDRVYMSQVEDGQPLESIELALDKAHQLIRIDSTDDAKRRLGSVSLSRYFGNLWLESWPDVAAKVDDAQAVLDGS